MSRVLITRPQPDADAFVSICETAGLTAVVAPVMSVRFLHDWTLPQGTAALAFTSSNGVRAFAHGSAERELPVFCVGDATEEAARQSGFKRTASADGDVNSLAALIADNAAAIQGELVHIAGTKLAGDLSALLDEKGVPASRLFAYEATAVTSLPNVAAAAIEDNDPLCVALFSPRTARIFLDLTAAANLNEALTTCRAVCLSAAVAEMTRQVDWRRIDVANARSNAAMIDAIKLHT